ncbi:hypothetical protein PPL_07759 [Heterostelium album PN500]|uniref:Uncharacterized protein n=1 Tax=Heterostelium pallidum (strain ATCC 26659 / Pp 5 / PN500) TaxID=670386 RepID=D3BGV7_HETP5|nr:hypothetical protein PPL_07759 [Heterostelium album PN500]EFA79341.1 hypothetical protein PPL_07759 [Heterostelium album PN500]|eukprot:XP_020431462.1 hypothetical protein PPL_07759 [Heterostelium album PN500]
MKLFFDDDLSKDIEFEVGSLPSSLTKLSIGNDYNQPLHIGILPASLEYLEFSSEIFNQIFEPDALPSGLKSLKLGNGYTQPIKADILPTTLTNLDLGSKFLVNNFEQLLQINNNNNNNNNNSRNNNNISNLKVMLKRDCLTIRILDDKRILALTNHMEGGLLNLSELLLRHHYNNNYHNNSNNNNNKDINNCNFFFKFLKDRGELNDDKPDEEEDYDYDVSMESGDEERREYLLRSQSRHFSFINNNNNYNNEDNFIISTLEDPYQSSSSNGDLSNDSQFDIDDEEILQQSKTHWLTKRIERLSQSDYEQEESEDDDDS